MYYDFTFDLSIPTVDDAKEYGMDDYILPANKDVGYMNDRFDLEKYCRDLNDNFNNLDFSCICATSDSILPSNVSIDYDVDNENINRIAGNFQIEVDMDMPQDFLGKVQPFIEKNFEEVTGNSRFASVSGLSYMRDYEDWEQVIIKKDKLFEKIADEFHWSSYSTNYASDYGIQSYKGFEFWTDTCSQDVIFEPNPERGKSLIDLLEEYAENYSPEEEAQFYIKEGMLGKRGIPDSIELLLKDMREVKSTFESFIKEFNTRSMGIERDDWIDAGSIENKAAVVIPEEQLKLINELCNGEEGQFFKDKLEEVADTVTKISDPEEELVNKDGTHPFGIHLFHRASDSHIYITEIYKNDECFGFAILGGDHQMAEWGYNSLSEIKKIKGFEVDLHTTADTVEQALAKRFPGYYKEPSQSHDSLDKNNIKHINIKSKDDDGYGR